MDEKAIAIIPARGGSKGVPRKNLRYFNGKPIISYIINACLKAKTIGWIYVTTDNEEIAQSAIACGANVIDRPPELSTDEIVLEPAINHALCKIEEQGIKSDLIATLQITSPLLKSLSIDKVINLLADNPEVDSVISGYNDPHLGWSKIDNSLVPRYKDRLCRQWLPDDYRETGGILCTRRQFVNKNNRLGKNIKIYELPKVETIDVNDLYDWKSAESITQIKKIFFIIKTVEGAKSSIFISDLLGGHEINFISIDESKLAEKKIINDNFKVTNMPHSEILSFLSNNTFDTLIVEKDIAKLIHGIDKIENLKIIEDIIISVEADTLLSVIKNLTS
jgi:CMP-N-acetylneuraminic acid synthetase